jgi:hypothetical protein
VIEVGGFYFSVFSVIKEDSEENIPPLYINNSGIYGRLGELLKQVD